MKHLKESLQASRLKNRSFCYATTLITTAAIMLSSACSHKFVKIETNKDAKIISQVLKVKTFRDNKKNSFTVYSQVDRFNKKAILDGVGKFDKYIFNIEINGDRYVLKDYLNHEDGEGLLENFDLVPLTQKNIFEEIDIRRHQPIIFENKNTNTWVEVYVKEQKEQVGNN